MTRQRAWWLAEGFLRRRADDEQFPYTTTMSLIPDEVRVVYFDAVGTLIFPDPPVAEAYHSVGRRYGSQLTVDEVRRRFYAAFAAEERLDAVSGNRTSREREQQRWRSIVTQTLPDVAQPEVCFADLYDHFANPAHWWVTLEAREVLAALLRRKLEVGLASNFDERLTLIVEGWEELHGLGRIVVSSEIGWRKPAPQFFAALCNGHSPNQVLLVGDDRVNDYDGARAAGLHAILLDETTTLMDLLS
jgi:putative hydrolase of the HAD superfamily